MPHTGKRPHHEDFVARCRGLAPLVTAVVHPCDRLALEGALACAEAGLIVPLLVGNDEKIRAVDQPRVGDGRTGLSRTPPPASSSARASRFCSRAAPTASPRGLRRRRLRS